MMLQNLATLLSHLNNKVDIFRSPHAMFSHIDFVWAKDVKELVNNVVLSIFASKSKPSLSAKCVRRWHLFARQFSSDCKEIDDKKHHYNKSAKILVLLNVQTMSQMQGSYVIWKTSNRLCCPRKFCFCLGIFLLFPK